MLLVFSTNLHYIENDFQQRFDFFVGAAGDGAAPTVACQGAQTSAAPTNRTAEAAGVTSHPYKWGLIYRGGSITSRPQKWYLQGRLMIEPPLQMAPYLQHRFVGAAQSPVAPTNDPVFIAPICRGGSITSRPYKCPPYKIDAALSFSSGHSLQPVKER